MTSAAWQPSWLASTARLIRRSPIWRGVEAQYASATTQLVDSLAEQDLLERILEDSKPPLPRQSVAKHFLLATPFRYTPEHASRFRPRGQAGLWYGADTLRAACAEVAYWRRRFITDSEGLKDQTIITRHTFFAASVRSQGINLMEGPWLAFRSAWTSDDYTETHRLAEDARRSYIELIVYESARAPGDACVVIFAVDAW